MADKQDMLYQALTREIDILKNDLLNEMRSSVAQVESLCESVKTGNSESCELITKEIRYGYKQNENIYNGVESILKDELDTKLSAVEEKKFQKNEPNNEKARDSGRDKQLKL